MLRARAQTSSKQGAYVIALVVLQSKTFKFSMFDHALGDVGAAVSWVDSQASMIWHNQI